MASKIEAIFSAIPSADWREPWTPSGQEFDYQKTEGNWGLIAAATLGVAQEGNFEEERIGDWLEAQGKTFLKILQDQKEKKARAN